MKDKTELRIQNRRQYLIKSYLRGMTRLKSDEMARKNYLLLCAVMAALFALLSLGVDNQGVMAAIRPMILTLYAVCWAVLCVLAVLLFGWTPEGFRIYDDMVRAGIVNSAGEAPLLISQHQTGKVLTLTFSMKGFPQEKWQDSQSAIETALNAYILDIALGKDQQTYIIQCVPADNAFKGVLSWQDDLLAAGTHNIVLGQDAAGNKIDVNFSNVPHWMAAAATGMGKTCLLLMILHQMKVKGWEIFLADYKGVDFGPQYRVEGHYADEPDTLIPMLEAVIQELNSRKQTLIAARCANSEEYRSKTGGTMNPIVVVVDEASMVLDTTGRDKNEKEAISKILGCLCQLGRLGRAMDIHLIIATQRPDVASVPGALKAQTDGRVAGHCADAQSSIVILDDGSAAKLPAIPGRFLVRDGTGVDKTIQAFYYKE